MADFKGIEKIPNIKRSRRNFVGFCLLGAISLRQPSFSPDMCVATTVAPIRKWVRCPNWVGGMMGASESERGDRRRVTKRATRLR